jgi:glucokinase
MEASLVREVAIGIDVGGTNVRAARVDGEGRLDGHLKVRTDSGSSVTELAIGLCRSLLDDDVTAIGLGIPGRIDRDGATIFSSGYVDLAGQRPGEVIADAVGLPVVLENDAHMALLAELQLGAAAAADDVVMFTVGTGIGGAVALDRLVVRGRGNAGQLGHLTLDPGGPVCNCGRRGCSEVLASGTALNRLIGEAGLPSGITAEMLLERRASDPTAAAVLGRWADAWRDAIDSVVAVLDPDLVVLGGGLGGAAVATLQACGRAAPPWFECPVVAAQLGDDAGVIGAGLRALGLTQAPPSPPA